MDGLTVTEQDLQAGAMLTGLYVYALAAGFGIDPDFAPPDLVQATSQAAGACMAKYAAEASPEVALAMAAGSLAFVAWQASSGGAPPQIPAPPEPAPKAAKTTVRRKPAPTKGGA